MKEQTAPVAALRELAKTIGFTYGWGLERWRDYRADCGHRGAGIAEACFGDTRRVAVELLKLRPSLGGLFAVHCQRGLMLRKGVEL